MKTDKDMEEKRIKEAKYKAKGIANARLLEEIKSFPEESLIEYAYELAKDNRKQEKQLEQLQFENEKLRNRIAELQKARKPTDKYAGYPIKKDYIAKLKFILDRNKHKMTFDEIVEAFYLVEPDLNDNWRNPNKSISKIISRAVGFGVIIREKQYREHGGYVYWNQSSQGR